MDFTPEDMRKRFAYDPSTGDLTWKIAFANVKVGDMAGWINKSSGYRIIKIRKRDFRVHRIIFAIMTGQWPAECIDHINGDRSDNRWSNLREATNTQNLWNKAPNKNSRTGIRGVHYSKSSRGWVAKIGHQKKVIHLGVFSCIEQARAARERAANELYGEFAYESSPRNCETANNA